MNGRARIHVVIGVLLILFGLLLVSLPFERQLFRHEYTSLESYPKFYHTNFTFSNAEANPELILDFNLDYANSYSSYTVLWMLLQLSQQQFEEDFNITEAHSAMSGEDWDLDVYWRGWFTGRFSPLQDAISEGTYIVVFWIVTDGQMNGWSVTLAATLRTSLLPLA